MTKINNLPTYAKNYKYIVARLIDGDWWFYGAYNDGFKALKRPPKKKDKKLIAQLFIS